MKRYLGFAKRFLLLVTPVVATSALATSPSQAATLAFSRGELYFNNFSENFSTIQRLNQGDTFGLANGGLVNLQNQAITDFVPSPPEALTFGSSLAEGESKDYFGLAETQGKILGNFNVDAGELFSFDFTARLNLATSIDEPPAENARASADISFLLFDTSDVPETNLSDFFTSVLSGVNNIPKNPLDSFSLVGNLNSLGEDDLLAYQKSQYITLSNEFSQPIFGGTEEFALADISGSLQRSFDKRTNLTLVAVRKGQVRVTAPEPSTYLGTLLFFVLVVAMKVKRKAIS